jgi:hypothetical protein
MSIRGPEPFLGGVKLGIILIAISGLTIALSIFIEPYSDSWFIFYYFFDIMILIFIVGWVIFLTNLSKYLRPYHMRTFCPFCGRDLAWDDAVKVWFCFHCERRIKRLRDPF